jgi:GrpB-like predicted nucleotidyltransferase (UPF0157 family)
MSFDRCPDRVVETLDEKLQRVLRDELAVVPYDPRWPELFRQEEEHLRSCLPAELVGRIEHVGSTAVPGLAAKPIVDMLVEVTSLDQSRLRIAPILESQGYDYFWRPSWGDDVPPFYAWFIKRAPGMLPGAAGQRTHHIHMVDRNFEQWDWVLFRDLLIAQPELASEYQALKLRLVAAHPGDRIAYTRGKTDFVRQAMERARR